MIKLRNDRILLTKTERARLDRLVVKSDRRRGELLGSKEESGMGKGFKFEFSYATVLNLVKQAIRWFGWDDEICKAVASFRTWAIGIIPAEGDVVERVVGEICDAILEELDVTCPKDNPADKPKVK